MIRSLTFSPPIQLLSHHYKMYIAAALLSRAFSIEPTQAGTFSGSRWARTLFARMHLPRSFAAQYQTDSWLNAVHILRSKRESTLKIGRVKWFNDGLVLPVQMTAKTTCLRTALKSRPKAGEPESKLRHEDGTEGEARVKY